MLENYECVSEMSDMRLTVLGRKDILEIGGENLLIREIRKSAMVIEGDISEIVFLKRRTAE